MKFLIEIFLNTLAELGLRKASEKYGEKNLSLKKVIAILFIISAIIFVVITILRMLYLLK